MTAKTMHQGEADLRAALATLAEQLEQIVAQAPRHPRWLYIDPLSPFQRAEHDRAVGYRNVAVAVRDILRTGQPQHDLKDDAELKQQDEETAS